MLISNRIKTHLSAGNDEREEENYNVDNDISDNHRNSTTKKRTNKRKCTSNRTSVKRKRSDIKG
jgi:hypothetical protein